MKKCILLPYLAFIAFIILFQVLIPNSTALNTPDIHFWKNVLLWGTASFIILGAVFAALINSKINSLERVEKERIRVADSIRTTIKEKTTQKPLPSQVTAKNLVIGDENKGHVGDIYNIPFPPQPHPDETTLAYFTNNYPSDKYVLRFEYSTNSPMSQVYTQELLELLNKAGYSFAGLGWVVEISGVTQLNYNQRISLIQVTDPAPANSPRRLAFGETWNLPLADFFIKAEEK